MATFPKCLKAAHKVADNKGNKHRRYSAIELAWLAEHIKGRSIRELTGLFNARFSLDITPAQVRSVCRNRKLVSGRDTRFAPGHKPHNVGIKGWGAGEAGKGSVFTRFAKGNKPWNYRPVGTERIVPHRNGWFEIQVKTANPKTWKAKHLLVWEAANGPVPKGYSIVFADQNRANCSLENLILVTRAELARLNQSHLIFKDADLTRTGVAMARLMSEMHKKQRGRKQL